MEITKYGKELVEEKTKTKNHNMKAYMFLKELQSQGRVNVTSKTLQRMHDCNSFWKAAINSSAKKNKLLYAERCHSRFCEFCQKSDSITEGEKLYTVANYLRQTKKYEFLFITLTVKNVKGKQLKDEIRRINQSVDKMFHRVAFNKNVFKGYVTKMEITYNRKRYDYHPHLHLLLAVDKNYFTGKDYLTREKLLNEWKTAYKDRNITQVHIEKVSDFEKSILEISKYEAKSNDLLINKNVFETYYNAISGSKVLRYNREFKLPALAYDEDKYGLFDTFKTNSEDVEFEYKMVASWIYQNKNYQSDMNELTLAELEYLKKHIAKRSYDDFVSKWEITKINREKLYPELERIEKSLQKNISPDMNKYYKDLLSKQKTKISNLNLKINIYEFINTNLRMYFKY